MNQDKSLDEIIKETKKDNKGKNF